MKRVFHLMLSVVFLFLLFSVCFGGEVSPRTQLKREALWDLTEEFYRSVVEGYTLGSIAGDDVLQFLRFSSQLTGFRGPLNKDASCEEITVLAFGVSENSPSSYTDLPKVGRAVGFLSKCLEVRFKKDRSRLLVLQIFPPELPGWKEFARLSAPAMMEGIGVGPWIKGGCRKEEMGKYFKVKDPSKFVVTKMFSSGYLPEVCSCKGLIEKFFEFALTREPSITVLGEEQVQFTIPNVGAIATRMLEGCEASE